MWPTLKLVHGKPRHPQSQGSVERANGDIKDMLVAWMSDQNKCESEPTESTESEYDSVTTTYTDIDMTNSDSNTIEIAENGINIRKRMASAADGQHSQADR